MFVVYSNMYYIQVFGNTLFEQLQQKQQRHLEIIHETQNQNFANQQNFANNQNFATRQNIELAASIGVQCKVSSLGKFMNNLTKRKYFGGTKNPH